MNLKYYFFDSLICRDKEDRIRCSDLIMSFSRHIHVMEGFRALPMMEWIMKTFPCGQSYCEWVRRVSGLSSQEEMAYKIVQVRFVRFDSEPIKVIESLSQTFVWRQEEGGKWRLATDERITQHQLLYIPSAKLCDDSEIPSSATGSLIFLWCASFQLME